MDFTEAGHPDQAARSGVRARFRHAHPDVVLRPAEIPGER
jgi:hypothetical protein